jgi:hypothetical protein
MANRLVYLIRSDDKYKIGVSTKKNLVNRIKNLQTGNSGKIEVLKTFESEFATLIEKTLHREFVTKKLVGEWFELSIDEVLTFEQRCVTITNNINLLKNQNNYYILKTIKYE